MKAIYYRLQLKRIFSQFPHILLAVLLLGSILGSISFFTGKVLYTKKQDKQLELAYTSEDDSIITEFVLNGISNSESLSKVCGFQNTTLEEAEQLLQNEEILAHVYIPPHFVDGLFKNKFLPLTITLPQHISLYSVIMKELLYSVETTLKSAQAGVYTLHDYYKMEGCLEREEEGNKKLNRLYLMQALYSSNVFDDHRLNVDDDVSLNTYMICGMIVLLLLFSGCGFVTVLDSGFLSVSARLKRAGISSLHVVCSQILAVALTMYTLFAACTILAGLLHRMKLLSGPFTGVTTLICTLVYGLALCLCAASIIVAILTISGGGRAGIILLFLVTTICGFLSGCLIPKAFLPETIQSISRFLPTTYMLEAGKQMVNGLYSLRAFLALGLWCLIAAGIGWLAHKYTNIHPKGGRK